MNHKNPENLPSTSDSKIVSAKDQSRYTSPVLTLFPDYVNVVLTGTGLPNPTFDFSD